jgi:hypothetical protein
MGSYGSLWVVMGCYGSLWVVMVIMGCYGMLRVVMLLWVVRYEFNHPVDKLPLTLTY